MAKTRDGVHDRIMTKNEPNKPKIRAGIAKGKTQQTKKKAARQNKYKLSELLKGCKGRRNHPEMITDRRGRELF
ncbi:MAG TPA: hypothetical protein VM008_08980 [Phycisphaerae bacterium]|nr:hypothetical protein [Phycisphaerae bacterium]